MNQATTAKSAAKPESIKKEPQVDPKAEANKAEAAPKEAKPKKEKKEGTVPRPRLAKPADDHLITVLKPNAKREASGLRYNEYRTGMTVKQYVDKMTAPPWNRTPGQVYADIRWDTDTKRNFIHIGPTVVPVPAAPAPAPAQPAQATA